MTELNTKYFDNVEKSIDVSKTCSQLQATANNIATPINGVKTSIQTQIEKLSPYLALATIPSANFGAIASWISNLSTTHILPKYEQYLKSVNQINSLRTTLTDFNNHVSTVASNLNGNGVTNPIIVPEERVTLTPQQVFNTYQVTNYRPIINITFSSNAENVDLINYIGSSYIAGMSDIVVTINNGVIISSNSTSAYSMYIRNFNYGDTILFVNNGYIIGKGGNGGDGGGNTSNLPGLPGSNGGHAIYIRFPITLSNNGIIGGGGGGGGGGGSWYQGSPTYYTTVCGAGGGGGAGCTNSIGGNGGGGSHLGGRPPSTNGAPGTNLNGGVGGTGWVFDQYAGNGGNGGNLGINGGNGSSGWRSTTAVGGAGGLAGNAIDGNSYVTWNVNGDIRGNKIN